jgi:hypothetical protein
MDLNLSFISKKIDTNSYHQNGKSGAVGMNLIFHMDQK